MKCMCSGSLVCEALWLSCALCFPETNDIQNRGYIITTTIIIAVASMVTLGWPTPCVLRCLKIEGNELGQGEQVDDAAAGPSRWVADATGRPSVGARFNNRIKSILLHKQAVEEDRKYLLEEMSIMQARRSSAAGMVRVSDAAEPMSAGGMPEQARPTAASGRSNLAGDLPWPSASARPSAISGRPSRSKRMITDP